MTHRRPAGTHQPRRPDLAFQTPVPFVAMMASPANTIHVTFYWGPVYDGATSDHFWFVSRDHATQAFVGLVPSWCAGRLREFGEWGPEKKLGLFLKDQGLEVNRCSFSPPAHSSRNPPHTPQPRIIMRSLACSPPSSLTTIAPPSPTTIVTIASPITALSPHPRPPPSPTTIAHYHHHHRQHHHRAPAPGAET